NDYLARAVTAKVPEDLGPIITQTRLIDNILGEKYMGNYIDEHDISLNGTQVSMADNYVFPRLIDEHKAIQTRLTGRMNYDDKPWGAIQMEAASGVRWIFYGMAAKSITSSVLMRWIPGTRFIYEPLQIAFDRARPMVTGYFLGLWTTMAADNGVIWSRINA